MDLFTIFAFLTIIISVLLCFIVLIQNSKGGGLSNTFGASNVSSMIGTRRANQDVERFTWYLGFGLFAVSFMANITMGGDIETSTDYSSMMNNLPTSTPTQNAVPGSPSVIQGEPAPGVDGGDK